MPNTKKLDIVDRKDYNSYNEYILAYTKKYNTIYYNNKQRYCIICNKNLHYFYYNKHLSTKKHIKNKLNSDIIDIQ